MNNIKQSVVNAIVSQAGLDRDYVLNSLSKSARPELGDYALACFRLAKEQKKVPQQLATEISSLIKHGGLIAKVQPVAGYVNIFLDGGKLPDLVLGKDTAFDTSIGTGKTIVIDYSSPNIAKPFGIGHLRSTVIGNALYKIYSALGYKCVGENFLGDWGTQFGMIIADYKENAAEYDRELAQSDVLPAAYLAERYAEYNERAEKEPALLDKARGDFWKLELGDKENTMIWSRFKELSLSEFQRVYDLVKVGFDSYNGEAYYQQFVDDTIRQIEAKGITQISDGALIVDLAPYNMPPCLLRKKDGATLYAARDIAAAIHRYNNYRFHKLIYVVGSDQKLHFRQFFKVLELMEFPWAKDCVHVDFGLVRFKDAGGAKQKMSTRRGTTILLENVLNEAVEQSGKVILDRISEGQKNRTRESDNQKISDEESTIAKSVGIGAIIFNDLKNKRNRDVDFDWAQMLAFDGETGPYLQYAHTRLGSLLKKYEEHKSQNPNLISHISHPISPIIPNYKLLVQPEEIALIKALNDFEDIIRQSAAEYEPSVLSNYLLNLSSFFNRYYQIHRIISDDIELSAARIALVERLKKVFYEGLGLLGIVPLEKM